MSQPLPPPISREAVDALYAQGPDAVYGFIVQLETQLTQQALQLTPLRPTRSRMDGRFAWIRARSSMFD